MNLTLVSLLPFLVLTYLLLIQKVSAAKKTMLAVYALTAGLLYFFWQADLHLLPSGPPSLKGTGPPPSGWSSSLIIIGVDAAVFPAQAHPENWTTPFEAVFFQSLFPPNERIFMFIIIGWFLCPPFWKVWPPGIRHPRPPIARAPAGGCWASQNPLLAPVGILTLKWPNQPRPAVAFGAFGTTIVVGPVASAVPGIDLAPVYGHHRYHHRLCRPCLFPWLMPLPSTAISTGQRDSTANYVRPLPWHPAGPAFSPAIFASPPLYSGPPRAPLRSSVPRSDCLPMNAPAPGGGYFFPEKRSSCPR